MDTEIAIPLHNGLFAKRYRPLRMLGKGGMGEVYLVQDSILEDEEVALKVLKKDYLEDEKHTARFLREVKLARLVTHPAVVRTYDVGESDGILYFTMEYVVGESIKEFLQRERVFPYTELVKILIPLCEGLAEIHKHEIVHRDLKPANILLMEGEGVKITDFGIARPGSSQLTHADEIVGSTHYLAPEIWLGKELSSATDIYALGIVAYEMLTGATPFDAENPAELMWKHLDVNPVEPSTLEPSVPKWLDELILALISKDQDTRPCNAHEIAEYLLRASAEDEVRKTGDFLAPVADQSVQVTEVVSDDAPGVLPERSSVEKPEQDLIEDRLTSAEIPVIEPEVKEQEPVVLPEKKSFFARRSGEMDQIGKRAVRLLLTTGVVGGVLVLSLVLFPLVIQKMSRLIFSLTSSKMFANEIRGYLVLAALLFLFSLLPTLLVVQKRPVRHAVREAGSGCFFFFVVTLIIVAFRYFTADFTQLRLFLEEEFSSLFAVAFLSMDPVLNAFSEGDYVRGVVFFLLLLLSGAVLLSAIRGDFLLGRHLLRRRSWGLSLLLLGVLTGVSLLCHLLDLFSEATHTFLFASYSFEISLSLLVFGGISLTLLMGISLCSPGEHPHE
ncbi:serine/threonine protein kinase [bacterium]|nr:serine/threonine protein kinase [bacterium]